MSNLVSDFRITHTIVTSRFSYTRNETIKFRLNCCVTTGYTEEGGPGKESRVKILSRKG